MNKIEMGKKYRTRDGWPARVICVDAKTPRQVIAIAEDPHDPSDDFVIRTTMEGRFRDSSESGHDLIEVGPYDDFTIDEPAFPIGSGDMRDPTGMTLRDYFAAKAMPAIYKDFWDDVRAGRNTCVTEDWRTGLAIDAYEMADAMLNARSSK